MVDDYPVIVAANRDEHYDRPSLPPRLWSTEPKILAGKDLLAGGTWLGVNEYGLLVGILNRRSNKAPDPLTRTRSRGLLCLDLLNLKSATAARAFLTRHGETYQPFTVVFVDSAEAWTAYNMGREIKTHSLNEGLHVYSSAAEFDAPSEKIDRAHQHFAQIIGGLGPNRGDRGAWVRSLRAVLGDHTLGNDSNDPREAICVHGEISGTVSSTIILYAQPERRFYTFNCAGPPCQGVFGEDLTLDGG